MRFLSTAVFSPQSTTEFKAAVPACLKLSPESDCSLSEFGSIDLWDVSRVDSMTWTFYDKQSFDADISKWDVSNVTDLTGMFAYASSFNGNISEWDISRVTDTSHMFRDATSFNQDISKWDVSQVIDMFEMFSGAASFNQNISNWNVKRVMHMDYMFFEATAFNYTLCGVWARGNASRTHMFLHSPGSMCATETTPGSATTSISIIFGSATTPISILAIAIAVVALLVMLLVVGAVIVIRTKVEKLTTTYIDTECKHCEQSDGANGE